MVFVQEPVEKQAPTSSQPVIHLFRNRLRFGKLCGSHSGVAPKCGVDNSSHRI